MSQTPQPIASSFRDPAGYMFVKENYFYRYVSAMAFADLDTLHTSGLYNHLVDAGYLVSHQQIEDNSDHRILKPEQIPFISYPFEWSFSQLRAAALLTLNIQKAALNHGMSLKDASAYNVQFSGSQPKFIDTLSFEDLDESRPWAAYKQFCEHFLGPLALMAHVDLSLNKLLLSHLDGIPLSLVSATLPRRTKLRYGLLVHLHLHAKSQTRHANSATAPKSVQPRQMSKPMLLALVESLISAVQGCKLKTTQTEWSHYYDDTNYSSEAMDSKTLQISTWLETHVQEGDIVHDVGANTGNFSRLAAKTGATVIAHDIDMMAVDRHFLSLQGSANESSVLPLHLDVTNPSPAIGWMAKERDGFFDRCTSGNRTSMVLALALVHHLAISNNTPLDRISEMFAQIGDKLIIEFVPKDDSQVERLLASREDIFPNYTIDEFERAFKENFNMLAKHAVEGSQRTLYLFERHSAAS